MLINLVHGQPIRFGADHERGVVIDRNGEAVVVDVADVGEDALVVHDETRPNPAVAFALSRLAGGPTEPTPIGVFRQSNRPEYAAAAAAQVARAQAAASDASLHSLLRSNPTWDVG